jgi:nucleobase:cation symporter-1, NCS1 family
MGQIFSFPLYAIICSIIGILVIVATQNRFGGASWNLPDTFTTLVQNRGSRERAAGFFAGTALVVSRLVLMCPAMHFLEVSISLHRFRGISISDAEFI